MKSRTDRASRPASRPFGLWWLSPAGALTFVVPATLVFAMLVPESVYQGKWRTPKALTTPYVWMLGVGALIMIAASLLPLLQGRRPINPNWPNLTPFQKARLVRAADWVYWLTVFGYVALLLVGIARGARPSLIMDVLISQDNNSGSLKELFAPVSGITSFTQMGMAYAVVGSYLTLGNPTRRNITRLLVIVFLALLRAFFLTERLAVIEVLIPIVVVASVWALARANKRSIEAGIQLAPLFMVPLVAIFFGLFEFSRSWVWYRENGASSFLSFAGERFGGYYATAYNNGQMLYEFQRVPGRLPYRSIEGFWSAPVIEQIGLYDRLETATYPSNLEVLTRSGNPEFNNPCGLCDPFTDWGPPGGWVFLACLGFLLGVVYVAFTSGRSYGLMVYPPLVTGMYEIPRYVYFTNGRLVPSLVALLLIGWWLRGGPPPESARGNPAVTDAGGRGGLASGHGA